MVISKIGGGQISLPVNAEAIVSQANSFPGRSVAASVSDDDIRAQAYRLYERRGRTEGHAIEDWLAAERYLRARKNRANKVIFR